MKGVGSTMRQILRGGLSVRSGASLLSRALRSTADEDSNSVMVFDLGCGKRDVDFCCIGVNAEAMPTVSSASERA